MADQGDDDDTADSAARAFQNLHAEVIGMRRLVEGLPHEWEDKRPPDYIYAAEAAGDTSKAQDIARILQTHDPDIPSVKKYLP